MEEPIKPAESSEELYKTIRGLRREGLAYRLVTATLVGSSLLGVASIIDFFTSPGNVRQSYAYRAGEYIFGDGSKLTDTLVVAAPIAFAAPLPLMPFTVRASRKAYRLANILENRITSDTISN